VPLTNCSKLRHLRPLCKINDLAKASRPTLEPSDLVAQGINRSPKLGPFPKQLQHQIFEFGVRKAVEVKVGRRHFQNESDSRPLVNRIIVPPRLLPLLHGFIQSSEPATIGKAAPIGRATVGPVPAVNASPSIG